MPQQPKSPPEETCPLATPQFFLHILCKLFDRHLHRDLREILREFLLRFPLPSNYILPCHPFLNNLLKNILTSLTSQYIFLSKLGYKHLSPLSHPDSQPLKLLYPPQCSTNSINSASACSHTRHNKREELWIYFLKP